MTGGGRPAIAPRAFARPRGAHSPGALLVFPKAVTGRLELFVVDTGPAHHSGSRDTLDGLLKVDAELVIPDAVFQEATRDASHWVPVTFLTG